MKSKLIFLIISFLILAGVYWFVLIYQKTASVENRAYSVQEEIPDVFSEFEWTSRQITKDESVAGDFRVHWRSQNNKYGEISAGGLVYEITLNDHDDGYEELKKYFMGMGTVDLDYKFAQNNWLNASEYGDYYLTGAGSDGPFGSTVGFIKINGHELRTTGYRTTISYTKFNGPMEPPGCPCSLKVDIFMSDPVILSDDVFESETE